MQRNTVCFVVKFRPTIENKVEIRTHHLNHFQVSGVSSVFCNSHHVCCRCLCLLWFWWSLSRLQHQFQKRHFLTKSFRSISIHRISFCYIHIYLPLGVPLLVYRLPGSGLQLWARWIEQQRERPHLLLHPRGQEWRTATHNIWNRVSTCT